MNATALVGATVALSLERASYVWVDWQPDQFERATRMVPILRRLGPVKSLVAAFGAFKVLQFGVFASWIAGHGGWCSETTTRLPAEVLGIAAVVVGQTLNFQVFRVLGTSGVFYGNRFGQGVADCRAFPFSVLPHPQYVGTCLSIWGLFLVVRFPCSDWLTLPAIETALYAVTALLERNHKAADD